MCTIIEEEWRDIAGYEGLYQVSNLGVVKSLGNGKTYNSKERILKQCKDINGYLLVSLYKDGKMNQFKVHRLVAQAFIPNPENKPCVNHKDENKENNIASAVYGFNLEWCDYKYNSNYGTRNKRIAEKLSKKVLCVETGKVYPSTQDAQRITGVNQESISRCCNGKQKTAGKYHWKFIE